MRILTQPKFQVGMNLRPPLLSMTPPLTAPSSPSSISSPQSSGSPSILTSFGSFGRARRKWVQWVDSYQDHVVDYDDRATGAGFLDFTRASGITETSDFEDATPGFRRLLARAWIVVHKNHNSLRAALGLGALSQLLFSRMRPKNLEHVDEIIEGSGGSLSHLASLVVKFIDEFDPDSESLMLKQDARLRGHIFEFIDDIDRFLGPRERDATIAGPFSVALLSAGIISSILTMATGLIKPNPENPPFSPLVEKSLAFLNRMLLTMPEHHWCSDAIDAGLLQVIISCSAAEKFQKTMRSLLDDVLPASLIHYYGLQVVEDELVEAMKARKGVKLSPPACCKAWESFVDLARERLGRVRSFDDTWKQRLKSCDNAQCGNIGHSSLFGTLLWLPRLSITVLRNCQESDWDRGQPSEILQPAALPPPQYAQMTNSACANAHSDGALLSHDYNVAKYDHIYPAQALLLACDPPLPRSSRSSITVGAARSIEVQLLSDSEVVQSFRPDSDWPNEVARASALCGADRAACDGHRLRSPDPLISWYPSAKRRPGRTRWWCVSPGILPGARRLRTCGLQWLRRIALWSWPRIEDALNIVHRDSSLITQVCRITAGVRVSFQSSVGPRPSG
ncbi:hypothetical protein DFH09DRAFT_1094227 [Mycena vulgaris]|nr:hypothetical protein DFH09DRAFT_1094227 [Mycena vulgaris]